MRALFRLCFEAVYKEPAFLAFITQDLQFSCSVQSCRLPGRFAEQVNRHLQALFFFRQEGKTGIAPTKRILDKDVELKEGIKVTVNWEGEKVQGEILALDGKSCIFQIELHLVV